MKERPFFEELIRYLMGELHTPRVMALVYHGERAIEKVRAICGSTNPEEADPVSIRGAYGRITTKGIYENVIHASSNEMEAEREIKLWFQPQELVVEPYPTQEIAIERQTQKKWS
jgi:nucleoside-diphosphate kinase